MSFEPAPPSPWSAQAGSVKVRVRLTPKSSRDALEGSMLLADGSAVLKARVRAVPEGGKANAALIALLAKSLGVARRDVAVTSGHTARTKTITITGEPGALEQRLRALAG